ncbi:cell filamentation protein [Dokdonella fugitiva]|uniref:Cell filamentation protein n=1 Tax=Dokdonella fugitiva TaxID=328517 RepID=A0A839F439_9GAMM|nr:Fic family protein [Dokdonella fugitiva]MBA8889823.1 cell filamentation protein [Dokdonella fugitiva]
MHGRYVVEGPEGAFEPGSRGRVLANLRRIVRVRDMQRAESDALLALMDALIEEVSEAQRFTTPDLCRWHRQWLAPIYGWAGAYREVNMAKAGFPFAAANRISDLMAGFEWDVLRVHTPCRDMDTDRLVTALAMTHAEFILIHPFREGNGRLARVMNTLMGLQAGLPALDYGGIRGVAKRRYIAAIHAAMDRDYEPLEAVFRSVIKRTLKGVSA